MDILGIYLYLKYFAVGILVYFLRIYFLMLVLMTCLWKCAILFEQLDAILSHLWENYPHLIPPSGKGLNNIQFSNWWQKINTFMVKCDNCNLHKSEQAHKCRNYEILSFYVIQGPPKKTVYRIPRNLIFRLRRSNIFHINSRSGT